MYNDDEHLNEDQGWDGRFEQALWLHNVGLWNESREALRHLADETEDYRRKVIALLSLGEQLCKWMEQEDLLGVADEVINTLRIRPDEWWCDGAYRWLMRAYLLKSTALSWADDAEGALHNLRLAIGCMSSSPGDRAAMYAHAKLLAERTSWIKKRDEREKAEREVNELRMLWNCDMNHSDPWECVRDIDCCGPESDDLQRWLRKRWNCPGQHAGPRDCDEQCPGPTYADDLEWYGIQRAVFLIQNPRAPFSDGALGKLA